MPGKDLTFKSNNPSKRRVLTLCITHDCNLRCHYCYEPTKSRDYYMSLKTAQAAITHYMEADDEFEEIEIDFFGGEPMLAFDLIQDIVGWFHSRPWRKGHVFFIGTNGTILTEEMKPWLAAHKQCLQIGVSLDGNKIAHDLNRSNSYDQVMQNLPFVLEHWPDQPIKMTISAETIPYVADGIIEMEERGLVFTANVVFEDIWGTPDQKSALLETYARQLDRLVEYYIAHPNLFPVSMLDRRPEYIYTSSSKPVGADCVRWCGAGHEMVMVEVDGTHFPCHRFAPWITGCPAPTKLVNRQTSWQPTKCAECRLISLCPTCAGFNWEENGDAGIRTTHHCEALKLEVAASAKLHAQRLLQQPREALSKLTPQQVYEMKQRVDAILELASSEW